MHSLFQLLSLSLFLSLFHTCSRSLSLSLPLFHSHSLSCPIFLSHNITHHLYSHFSVIRSFLSFKFSLAIVVLNAHFSYEIRDTIINTKYNLFRLLYNRKMVKRVARMRVVFRSHRVFKFFFFQSAFVIVLFCVCVYVVLIIIFRVKKILGSLYIWSRRIVLCT